MATKTNTDQANILLVIVGILLILAGLGNWFVSEDLEPSVVRETNTPGKTLEKAQPSRLSESSSAAKQRTKKAAVTKSGTKTVVSNPSDKIIETRPALGSRRSETMSIALIAFGFLSLLAGSAWPRIASITGPGGLGVTFAALSSVSDVTAKQEERLKALEASTEKINTTVELLVRQLIQASREE